MNFWEKTNLGYKWCNIHHLRDWYGNGQAILSCPSKRFQCTISSVIHDKNPKSWGQNDNFTILLTSIKKWVAYHRHIFVCILQVSWNYLQWHHNPHSKTVCKPLLIGRNKTLEVLLDILSEDQVYILVVCRDLDLVIKRWIIGSIKTNSFASL